MSASVIRSFVDLYNKGYIYRGYRMVNWDPEAKTTLSDEEVIFEERQGKLSYDDVKRKVVSIILLLQRSFFILIHDLLMMVNGK